MDNRLRRGALRQAFVSLLLSTGVPILVGAGVAAGQLLPTAELVGYSVRGETSADFFTSYSLPVSFLSQFFWPYTEGEPSEGTGEFWNYIGLVPLCLALLAPFLKRNRKTLVYLVFGLVALSLALGGSNPIYPLLYRLPLFGMFRVPARYLHLVIFAAAVLSGLAVQELERRLPATSGSHRLAFALGGLFAILTAGSIALAYTQPLDFWLGLWRGWPVALALVLAGWLVLAWRGRIRSDTFAALALGLAIVDLTNYFPPFLATIDSLTTAAYVDAVPRSVAALGTARSPERVFTDFSAFPSIPALRNSLFPNTSMAYGRSSAQAYTSLALARQDAFVFDPSPAMLNALNVRYLMIPLEPRLETRSSMPSPAFALDILDNEVTLDPTPAVALVITSYTEDASALPDGTTVAEIAVRYGDGRIETFPLRVGVETLDWDHDGKNSGQPISAGRAVVAQTFPGFWRSFGRTFEGHTYSARFGLDGKQPVIGVNVHPLLPAVRLVVASAILEDGDGQGVSLAARSGKSDFAPVFMSDTVAVWENQSVLPRAFVVHSAVVTGDEAAMAQMKSGTFHPGEVVLLSNGPALASSNEAKDEVEITRYESQRVTLDISTDQKGYLVLGDSWYPGWSATIDGAAAPIYRADVIFRAIPVEPGRHTISFNYHAQAFEAGMLIALFSLVTCAGVVVLMGRKIA